MKVDQCLIQSDNNRYACLIDRYRGVRCDCLAHSRDNDRKVYDEVDFPHEEIFAGNMNHNFHHCQPNKREDRIRHFEKACYSYCDYQDRYHIACLSFHDDLPNTYCFCLNDKYIGFYKVFPSTDIWKLSDERNKDRFLSTSHSYGDDAIRTDIHHKNVGPGAIRSGDSEIGELGKIGKAQTPSPRFPHFERQTADQPQYSSLLGDDDPFALAQSEADVLRRHFLNSTNEYTNEYDDSEHSFQKTSSDITSSSLPDTGSALFSESLFKNNKMLVPYLIMAVIFLTFIFAGLIFLLRKKLKICGVKKANSETVWINRS